MKQPLVSVVIPTYNRLALLGEAVASVRAQTLARWQLLVVDDGSDDGTVAAFAAHQDPRIELVSLVHSGIVGHVRNQGARRASGRYLAFLDSDDLWRASKLARQLEALEHSRATWSYTGYDVIGDGGRRLSHYQPPGEAGADEALLLGLLTTHTSAAMSSLAVSRATFERLGGFSTHPRIREDHDLVLRLAEAREPRIEIAEILMSIRQHARRSGDGERDAFERSAIAYQHLLARSSGDQPRSKRVAATARRARAGHLITSARIDHQHGAWRRARSKLWQTRDPGWRLVRWWWMWLRLLRAGRSARNEPAEAGYRRRLKKRSQRGMK